MSLSSLRLVIVAGLAALTAPGVAAAPSRALLGKASVVYDTAIWRAAVSAEAVTFTCIAADCMGSPHVFAVLSAGRDLGSAIAKAQRDGKAIRDDGVPPLPFAAISYWSGCRALDEPILFAGGQINGQGYIFTTQLTGGCNRGPHMPEDRFVELLRGFETN